MNEIKNHSVKLRSISIENYKGIDRFSMNFPIPELHEDSDILVMGSENGLGKTSIIECCALLIMCINIYEDFFELMDIDLPINVPDLLVKTGKPAAIIAGNVVIDELTISIEMRIDRKGVVKIIRNREYFDLFDNAVYDLGDILAEQISAICGFSPNPVIDEFFLLFHSYRKVQEGNPKLGMMINDSKIGRRASRYLRMERSLSEFKLIILRSLMNRANLFEFSSEKEPENNINVLNVLVKHYADGKINKLRPSADNTVDIRIASDDNGDSITFDGLSSGQKEIISTLFLIWYYTKDKPSVVFIDEPELHLNAQWHRTFINDLTFLAPENQYIIATHSESIMDSVLPYQRSLLQEK